MYIVTANVTGNLKVLAALHESESGPSAKFLAHAKKSLDTGVMRTRFRRHFRSIDPQTFACFRAWSAHARNSGNLARCSPFTD
jgi:hypothetical protein